MELFISLTAFVVALCLFFTNSLYWIKLTIRTLYSRMLSKLSSNMFKITNHEKYMTIEYVNNGSKDKVYIPVNMVQSFFASQSVVYAHYEDRKELIKQADNVPLMITANILGAKRITVRNTFTDIEKIYQGDEIPDYY